MTKERVYRLGDSTVVEPLVNRWMAWAYTVAPLAGSLHLLSYQIRLMQSYLENPQTHVKACSDPRMRSGPFIEIKAERADEVRALLRYTETRQKNNLELARCFMEFHNHLVREAKGQSLEPFYQMLPTPLRGYVELIYDYYHRPMMRTLEGLLYQSPYYHRELQSLRIFRQQDDGSRAFIMSTPRLSESDVLEWAVEFDSPNVDELFRLDCQPQPLDYIREMLGLSPEDEPLLQTLLAEGPPEPFAKWDGDGVRLRYFGHACVLIEWDGNSILTDPCLGVRPTQASVERYTYQDLPEHLDYVLITHTHHDHFCLESLLRLRHRIGCLVVPHASGAFYGDVSLKLMAQNLGFRNVVELETMEAIPLTNGEIISIPFMGEHADLPHSKSAYVVRAGDEQILFAADSDCLDRRMYEHVRTILGPISTVFLGMECVGAPLSWACGSFFPAKPEASHEKSRRYKGCDSRRGLSILGAVGAERLYVYAMGLEPWLEHLLGLAYTEDAVQLKEAAKFLAGARAEGLTEARLLSGKDEIVLEHKGTKTFSLQPQTDYTTAEAAEDHFKFN